jgi:phage-related minor tail protein
MLQDEQLKKMDQINASTQLQRDLININFEAEKRKVELLRSVPGDYEAMMVAQGRSSELTKEQIKLAQDYVGKQQQIISGVYMEAEAKKAAAAQDDALRKDFNAGWKGAYDKYVEDSKMASDQARTYFDTFSKGFEDSIVKFVQTGKLSFKDLANSIIADFARIQAKKLLVGLMDMGGGSGILGGLGKLLGFADGGVIPTNSPVLVGERGPELLMNAAGRTVIPNSQLGRGNSQPTMVTYNINAVDSASFQQLLARDPSFLYAVSEKGRRSLPQGAMR